jgi:hypothetical protein
MPNGRKAVAAIETVIATMCALTPVNGNQACSKAADAASIQMGVKQQDQQYEDKATQMVLKKTIDLLGKTTVYGVGGVVWIGNTVKNKSLTFELPKTKYYQSVNAEATTNSAKLNIKWTF